MLLAPRGHGWCDLGVLQLKHPVLVAALFRLAGEMPRQGVRVYRLAAATPRSNCAGENTSGCFPVMPTYAAEESANHLILR